MADSTVNDRSTVMPAMPKSLDEARQMARQRFKERLENGEQIGNCDCSTDDATTGAGPRQRLTGVRFLDSGRMYYFDPGDHELGVGDWVVVETSRGREAARVVIAPDQVRQSQLTGEIKPIIRKLNEQDLERMDRFKREASTAIRTFNRKIREHNLPMKPISAEYNFDGSHLLLNFTAPERVDFRELARDLSSTFRCRVELRQVGPRDEARLLGGLGRCGRTLCCASWLPVYPEISMNMAKTQDLPLNPGKVSGVCGRLLCCLSYENEQYRVMKSVMPRLGQTIETPVGYGMVISMQILKDLVTVRLEEDGTDATFTAEELGIRRSDSPRSEILAPVPSAPIPPAAPDVAPLRASEPQVAILESEAEGEDGEEEGEEGSEDTSGGGTAGQAPNRRRRRRGRGRRRGGPSAGPEA